MLVCVWDVSFNVHSQHDVLFFFVFFFSLGLLVAVFKLLCLCSCDFLKPTNPSACSRLGHPSSVTVTLVSSLCVSVFSLLSQAGG